MKKIITYIAWDGRKFATKEQCCEYEQDAIDMMTELCHCYEFYKDGKHLKVFVSNSLDNMIQSFDEAMRRCDMIKVNCMPSDFAYLFQADNFGYEMPDDVGLFKWDGNPTLVLPWVKVE